MEMLVLKKLDHQIFDRWKISVCLRGQIFENKNKQTLKAFKNSNRIFFIIEVQNWSTTSL